MKATKCSIIGCKKIAKTRGYCEMHYMRVVRHGTADQTRPADWGSREKHPLYSLWSTQRRFRRDVICKEWINDFWAFANTVSPRPDDGARHELYAVDSTKRIGPGNWCWVRCKERLSTKDKNGYMREYRQRMFAADPFYQKRKDLKRTYGVTLEWYESKLEDQKHACAICKNLETVEQRGKTFSLAVDHCHDTKQVRGLLCMACNRGLGFFRHDPKRLMAAISYLDAFPAR